MGNISRKAAFSYIEQHSERVYAATKNETLTDKIVQAARLAIFENPRLAQCEPSTLLRALVEAGRLGLIPGSMGHCYLVPRGKRASLEIGYRGWIWLASKSNIWPIEAHAVRAHDVFEVEHGTNKRLHHVPAFPRDPEILAVYAIATIRHGGEKDQVFTVMAREEVEDIRDRFSKSNQAWAENFEAMAIKTVIRRLIKQLPVASRLQDALAIDGAELKTDEEDHEEAIDVQPENETAAAIDQALEIAAEVETE
jgi:recombination protein RecT